MPSSTAASSSSRSQLLRFTNCQALLPDGSLPSDISTYSLHVDPVKGKIIDGQSAFFDSKSAFTQTIDLDGDYLVPGFIDVQINGGYGIDFSDYGDEQASLPLDQLAAQYLERLDSFSRQIIETGVTSFVPTIITQKAEMYRQVSLVSQNHMHTSLTRLSPSRYCHYLHREQRLDRPTRSDTTAKGRSCRLTRKALTARR